MKREKLKRPDKPEIRCSIVPTGLAVSLRLQEHPPQKMADLQETILFVKCGTRKVKWRIVAVRFIAQKGCRARFQPCVAVLSAEQCGGYVGLGFGV